MSHSSRFAFLLAAGATSIAFLGGACSSGPDPQSAPHANLVSMASNWQRLAESLAQGSDPRSLPIADQELLEEGR